MKKSAENLFLMPGNYSDIKEEINKQINTLKLFNMEPCNATPKKYFGLEEVGNCKEEINLKPQNKTVNIDWCKCGYECKSMAYCFG